MALRCIASLAMIVAIASAAMSSGAEAAEDRYAIVMPGRYEVEPSQVAPDMMLSILAIVNALRGERDLGKGAGEVHIASDASIVAGDGLEQARPFTYEGFALASVRLHRLEPSAYAPRVVHHTPANTAAPPMPCATSKRSCRSTAERRAVSTGTT